MARPFFVQYAQGISPKRLVADHWYVNGLPLTTTEDEWAIPLDIAHTHLELFKSTAAITSLEGDFDVGGMGFKVLIR